MDTTKLYAAKSSVARALKAAGLENAGYTVAEKDGKFHAVAPKAKKEGTKKERNGACRKVWDIADSMKNAKRSEVVTACVEAGINLGTAKTQYQSWFASQKG